MSDNLARSVHQRLLNHARKSARPFGEVLQHFALERFLYRLSQSPYRERFILKGGLMLHAISVGVIAVSRATRDIDLQGQMENEPEAVAAIVREICRQPVEADGLEFDAGSVQATRITEDAAYEGVRVIFNGHLGSARLRLQIDTGFGDPVMPAPVECVYPALLNFPPAVLRVYSKESTIAEKFSVMLRLGLDNSRMKDYYDIWMLSQYSDFDGGALAAAIHATCAARTLELVHTPVGLTAEFAAADDKAAQWRAFIRKSTLEGAPAELLDVVRTVADFLQPVLAALVAEDDFTAVWHPLRGWHE